jgi:hypothetical protein
MRQAGFMSGGALIGLFLLSMAWCFFLFGLVVHWQLLRRRLRARQGEQVPGGMGFLPSVVGSVAVFFTLPALERFGIDIPLPWLWILLPLVADPYLLYLVFRRLR